MGRKFMEKSYSEKWFYGCLMIMACVFGLFYARYVFCSDIPLHTLVAQTLLFQDVEADLTDLPKAAYAYPAYHCAQKLIHLLLRLDYDTSAALLLPMTIVASAFCYRRLASLIVEDSTFNRYFADALALGAVWFGVVRCPLNGWHFYESQCSPNPFHNPTILFVRPFAIGSFLFFLKFVQSCGQRDHIRYAAAFGALTLLSVAAKPSYAVVFLPAMGMYVLYDMLKNRRIGLGVRALLAVLPSLAALLVQFLWVSSKTERLDTLVRFGGFLELNGWQVAAASLVTFPVVLLLFRGGLVKREPVFFVTTAALVIGWLQMFMLHDGTAGNYSWGYDLAVQFATVAALAGTRNGEKSGVGRKILCGAAYGLFAYQVLTGVKYLKLIYSTGEFWL